MLWGYDKKTVVKIVVVAVLILAFLAAMFVADVMNAHADKPAWKGAENGNGKPPDHAKAGGRVGKWNGDPDDNGRGPERGDGTVDDEDWNHGCGNDEDRDDDNEGLCGRPRVEPPTKPTTGGIESIPKKVQPPKPTCKVVLIGRTPELFPANVDVRDPGNEVHLLAEAHGYLSYVVEPGTDLLVLWFDDALGHGGSIVEAFVCDGDGITLYEPVGLVTME